MAVVELVDPEPLDDTAKLWRSLMTIMDASPVSQAEKLGTIEFIKHEILTDMLDSARQAEFPG